MASSDRAAELRDLLNRALIAYHVGDAPIMEDAAYVPIIDDLQPVILAKSVRGFVNPPEDWFDLSTVWIED